MKHLGDITKINGYEIEPVDVITGGSPCQDLSVAGARKGLAGERSGLFMEQIRVIKEMREEDKKRGRTGEFIRPRWGVWENVPGAMSSNSGRDYQAVLTEFIRVIEPDAPDVPMPPKGKWPKSGYIYDELGKWSLAYRIHDAQWWGVPQRRRRIAVCVDYGGVSAWEVIFGPYHRGGTNGTGPEKSMADFGGIPAQEVLFEQNRLQRDSSEVRGERSHCARSIKDCIGGTNCDSLAVHQNASGEIHVSDVVYTIGTNSNASGRNTPIIFESHGMDNRYNPLGETCETLRSNYGTGGNNMPIVVHRDRPLVRRMTVLECERLQMFPAGWTDIGEWVDGKGKRHKTADSPRYKALGNSIALPYWKVILKRISAQYDRDATLGSLFSGIGGFDLCWAKINGPENVRWSSEIEPFPLAVMKKHFGDEETGELGDYYEAIQGGVRR